jgi:hypothetical protein
MKLVAVFRQDEEEEVFRQPIWGTSRRLKISGSVGKRHRTSPTFRSRDFESPILASLDFDGRIHNADFSFVRDASLKEVPIANECRVCDV